MATEIIHDLQVKIRAYRVALAAAVVTIVCIITRKDR